MLAEAWPISNYVLSEVQSENARPKQRLQPIFAFDQRQRRDTGTVHVEQVEDEEDQGIGSPLIHGCLQSTEQGNAIRTEGTEFAIEVGRLHGQGAQGADGELVAMGPIQARSREELGFPAVQPGMHAVSVVLDLMQPIRAVWCLVHQARQL